MSKKKLGLVLGFVLILATFLSAQQYKLLHIFAGAPSEGRKPTRGSVIDSLGNMYGVTWSGGTSDLGTIFMINANGTGYAMMHSFEGNPDGEEPSGSLVLIGGTNPTLYGMTCFGGSTDQGTIFKIHTNGTFFALLHSFGGGALDGGRPYGSLTLSGSTLYGMTYYGGTSNVGTIFRINTEGTGFGLLHSFAGGISEGSSPIGSLILSGSTLYGMTCYGGTSDGGTIFKINCDGTGYAVLLNFAYSPIGARPQGSLVLSGSTLYGMTYGGGANDLGMIFKIDTNGTNYAPIYSFALGTSNGHSPLGSLILSGSRLYGMTYQGGDNDSGTIFQINTNGTGFGLLHWFNGGISDGAYPFGDLFLTGFKLYGMTSTGGAYNCGVVFSYQLYADIGLTKSSDNIAPWPGSEFVFTITAKNNGPNDATGLSVTDQLPNGLTYVSSAASTGTYDSSAGSWSIGSLANGATATLALRVTAGSTPGMVTNTASRGGANEFDPNSSNNSASSAVTITIPQFSLITAANPLAGGTVTPAGTTAYNAGQSVLVQATSKAGYVFTGWSGSLTGWTNPATVVINGPMSITGNFASGKTLLAPVLVQPANGATGQPFSDTLSWQDTNSSPQELHYKVRIKPAGGAYKYYVLAANTTSYITSTLLAGKTYSWNVQALGNGTTTKNSVWANGGVDFKFTTKPPVTLNMPVLVSPANGAVDQPLSLTLQWQDTNSSPQELKYKVRFKKAGGAYANVTLNAGVTTLVKSGLARNKVYYWSVQAQGNGTSIKTSAFPADWSFTTIK